MQDNTQANKRLVWLLILILVLLTIAFVMVVYKSLEMHVHVIFADEQIEIIYGCEDRFLEATDFNDAVGNLEYCLYYYTSGSKQVTGSRLDRIVETVRTRTVSRMLDQLREKFDVDYGDDPAAWIAAAKAGEEAELKPDEPSSGEPEA